MMARLVLLLFLAHAAVAAPATLEEAIAAGDVAACRALLERGADVRAAGALGGTPLHAAAHLGYLEIARLLIERGADVNDKSSAAKQTPLHYAVQRGTRHGVSMLPFGTPPLPVDHLGIAKLLIEKGADVNARAMAGDTPLVLAADGGSLEMVDLLLSKDADPFDGDIMGLTPMDKAIKRSNTALIDRLLAAGVPLDGSSEHLPPVTSAQRYGRQDMVEYLLAKGAHPKPETIKRPPATAPSARQVKKWRALKGADEERACRQLVRHLDSAVEMWTLDTSTPAEPLSREFVEKMKARGYCRGDKVFEHPGRGEGSESLFVYDKNTRKVRCTAHASSGR
jgi:hypothetical protein